MPLEELIAAEPSDVRLCIDKIIDRAGTDDADWNVIKAAATLLNEASKRETDMHNTVIHLQAQLVGLRQQYRNARVCHD